LAELPAPALQIAAAVSAWQARQSAGGPPLRIELASAAPGNILPRPLREFLGQQL